jgi:RNA polymerase sigma factor (TIGR02999 family)
VLKIIVPIINALDFTKSHHRNLSFLLFFSCATFDASSYAMQEPSSHEVTQMLRKWSDGDAAALEELTPIIYAELHRMAKRYIGRERKGHTLQTTALVNEAYIRLIDWKNAKWENRAHFFGVSAQLMRRILVDFARKQPKAKDTQLYKVSLDKAEGETDEKEADLVALDEALNELAKFDERKARIVEMKFFGGLKSEEIAAVLGVAEITVLREWQKAKAWLYLQLNNK